MSLPDRAAVRRAALSAAMDLHVDLVGAYPPTGDREETARAAVLAVRRTADVLAAWLAGTTRLHLTPGLITDEAADVPTGTPTQKEGVTMTQLNTGQQVTYTVDTEDASGYDTVETIEWVVSEPGVLTLNVSEDTRSATIVSGAPGSGVLTARISSLGLEVTEAIDVVPAGTATIKLVAGDVVDEVTAPGEGE